MKIEPNSLKLLPNLAPADIPVAEVKPIRTWGIPLLMTAIAAIALVLVWFKGDWVQTPQVEDQKSASLWILGTLSVSLLLQLYASRNGAFRNIGAVFRRQAGIGPLTKGAAPKRDARLDNLRAELRLQHGYRWRYRLPWLLVAGDDALTEAVAPGLRQTGFALTEHAVLLHAAPQDIDAGAWRSQIRRLRRRRPVDTVIQVMRADRASRPDGELARTLAAIATDLGWAAPVTLLHPVPATGRQPEAFQAIGAFISGSGRHPAQGCADTLARQLTTLELHAGTLGVWLCGEANRMPYLAQVSAYIGEQRERVVKGWEGLTASKWLRAPLDGVMFAPVFAGPAAVGGAAELEPNAESDDGPPVRQPPSMQPTWQHIGGNARQMRGKRVGFDWPTALATLITVAAIAWCVALIVSFAGNRQLITHARTIADVALEAAPGSANALRAQLALQQTIVMLQYRQAHGAPWHLRAGLSRLDDVLAALWQPYRIVSERNLQRPAARMLGLVLTDLGELPDDSVHDTDTLQRGYDALKAYLMLAEPARTEPAFLAQQLLAAWSAPAGMPPGEWADTASRLTAFYAQQLKAHPEWRIDAEAPAAQGMLAGARATLVNQIGLSNRDDMLYQRVLDAMQGKYTDVSLATLLAGADARGLFSTTRTVPGVYTRAAWDGAIAQGIDRVSRERAPGGDWVLAAHAPVASDGTDTPVPSDKAAAGMSPDEIKARLTVRYFSEYTMAWQGFLNSLRWHPASNLSGAIDQLTRLADAQQSPLIALMKAVQYQAHSGRPSQSLSDTLVRRAQDLLQGADPDPAELVPSGIATAPLDESFGPLLALMGDAGNAAAVPGATPRPAPANDVSLARYLTRVTTVRLKLQQIAASPQPQAMARSLAQAVFQGQLSDLMQARDDAGVTAASLGQQWAGFGHALFAQPLDMAWQTILAPAAASLNASWREGIAMPFSIAFNGRYPFADTTADASFAELGRYVRPDTGLIARFVATQLAGVLVPQGERWVPNPLVPQSLRIDPAFLAALNQLSALGAQGYLRGDAGYRFELMALPAVDVTRTELVIDGRPIVYFNQRESWTPIAWPGDGLNGRASLRWHTVNAGARQAFDATGDWAFLRLLEKAQTTPLDSTRYALTWQQPGAQDLQYVLRTQTGAGPLDLLGLRGFKMPERIFAVDPSAGAHATASTPSPGAAR